MKRMVRVINAVLMTALILSFTTITQKVSASPDSSYIKEFIATGESQTYVLMSNGDLLIWDGDTLQKYLGNVSDINQNDIFTVQRKDGKILVVKDPKEYSSLTDLGKKRPELGKVTSEVGEFIVNEKKELWYTPSYNKPSKIMDDVFSLVISNESRFVLKTNGELWRWEKISEEEPMLYHKNVRKIMANGQWHSDLLYGAFLTDMNELYVLENSKEEPVKILDNVRDFSLSGYSHLAAVTYDNKLYTFGNNTYGQLGNDTFDNSETPEYIMDKVLCVSTGYNTTFVIRENGEVFGWGDLGLEDRVKTPKKLYVIEKPRVFNVTGNYTKASQWAIPELKSAEEKGLLESLKIKDFSKPITREQFCEVVINYYRAMTGKSVDSYIENPFTDTKNKKVIAAYNLGIVKGKTETEFSPESPITREEISVMLKRALDKARPEFDFGYKYKRFEDEEIFSPFAVEAIKYMRSLEVAKGDSSNKFNPKFKTSAQEAVTMVYRLLMTTD